MSIVIENLSKSFDGKSVLRSFCAEIPDNAVTCLMGESGCGKTTLLYLLAGLIKPDSGTVVGIPDKNAKIAFVFQENRLVENVTVYRNLRLVEKVARSDLGDMLEEVGMERTLLNKPVSSLSGGMKRRVAILRAMLCDSAFVFLDEPTNGLDEDNKKLVAAYIRQKCKGKTVLWVTHDRAEAESIADKRIELD